MIKNITIGVLVLTTLLFGGFYFSSVSFGGSTGPTHYSTESFLQGLTAGMKDPFKVSSTGIVSQGGPVVSTTSPTTLTASNIINNGTVYIVPNAMVGTVTLPTKAAFTAASASFIPNNGDRTVRFFTVATSTANARVTFAGSAGVILQIASTTLSQTTGISSIDGNGTGILTFVRSATTTDIYVIAQFFK